jgi:hypothetical protein
VVSEVSNKSAKGERLLTLVCPTAVRAYEKDSLFSSLFTGASGVAYRDRDTVDIVGANSGGDS